ncbi:MAG TPA: M23 family metallopeptidase [Anaerolineaceae bacterium]|nr:M23 family metallopeptidase [Anaerolineaceae bacterium]
MKRDTKVEKTETTNTNRIISIVFWGLASIMVALLIFVAVQFFKPSQSTWTPDLDSTNAESIESVPASLPNFQTIDNDFALIRYANPITIIPTRARTEATTYTIQNGDSVFGIAQYYDLTPETILWANKDTMNDDPHMISVGGELRIPPTNGVFYQWKTGDTINSVASQFKVDADAILDWTPNKIDRTNPEIEPDTFVMIPGGQREFQQWIIPTIPRGRAGVNSSIPGACDTSAGGAYGSGTFIWPTNNRFISGNDYWSGHLAIDIGAMTGDNVYAADSGVVVYAGGISGGYGNMVMIDHGNGYQTLYAHLNSINTRCGASVYQGGVIGYAGSTGNSTGAHLHFEVRFMGGFLNPHYVLP